MLEDSYLDSGSCEQELGLVESHVGSSRTLIRWGMEPSDWPESDGFARRERHIPAFMSAHQLSCLTRWRWTRASPTACSDARSIFSVPVRAKVQFGCYELE